MVEKFECDEPTPCEYAHRCEDGHRKKRVWSFHKFTTKLGTAHGHLARVTSLVAKYVKANIGYTGEVRLMQIDSDKLDPVWGDAETAAYKLGGIEAVKRLQKGLVAEAKAAARAQARADKAVAKTLARAKKKADRIIMRGGL